MNPHPIPDPLRIHPERRSAVPGGEIVRRCDLSTCAHCGQVIVRAVRGGHGFWQHLETAERACAEPTEGEG
jgi:hypothetical protein